MNSVAKQLKLEPYHVAAMRAIKSNVGVQIDGRYVRRLRRLGLVEGSATSRTGYRLTPAGRKALS